MFSQTDYVDDYSLFLESELEDYADHDAYDMGEETSLPNQKKSPPVLKNTDYNLNSPLMRDESDYIYQTYKGFPTERRNNRWKVQADKLREASRLTGVKPEGIINPALHHTKLSSIIYSNTGNISLKPILKRWQVIYNLTREPTVCTLSYLGIKSQVRDISRRFGRMLENNLLSKKMRQELNTFIDCHILTQIMNTSGDQTWDAALKNLVVKQWGVSSAIPMTGAVAETGDIQPKYIFTERLCFFVRQNMIVSKDFVLMIKDIALARLMTQLAMLEREDDKGGDHAVELIRELYDEGDNILNINGSKGYKAIKLLEAECTERWNQLGNAYRPWIPLSETLNDHLKREQRSLFEEDGIESSGFTSVVRECNDPWIIGQMYGAYRHWGHPYIQVFDGLRKLRDRVTAKLDVKVEFAEQLGSEMAFMVLDHQFKSERKWYCTSKGLPDKSPLKACIDEGVWPTSKVIEDFGPHWHELELLPCYDLPQDIDPTDMFSDKSHSMNRSEVLDHVKSRPHEPIPGRRVMETLIKTELPNVKEFLTEINNDGMTDEDLVIGLKPKERELKADGRFFSLMSWKLRLYFVITEYLIKKFYVPLFSGLTMADDLNTVMKKMLAATEGQGNDTYEKIYIANSLDYDKWNNNQRYESNQHVFRVMGKFLGLPEIFAKTHKFFEASLIYYCDRPDLMEIEDEKWLKNVDESQPVTWRGQAGGFEGLRQKGWSILNYLILRREIKFRNASTLIIAQGDNQNVVPQYTITNLMTEKTTKREIMNIWNNNASLMTRIQSATKSLGLKINQDEVVTSSELLIYGKIPIFRGKVIALESKRWSRVSSSTNDQIPSVSTAIAAAVTSAIAVGQYSEDVGLVMEQFHFFVSFVGALTSLFNPIIGPDPYQWNRMSNTQVQQLFTRMFYKDPSLGGVCGTNLFRFIVSRFPDPVCESLSWWKAVHEHTEDPVVRSIAEECGNPHYGRVDHQTLTMLLESPTSLNIPGGLSSNTLIKNKILEGLIEMATAGEIANQMLKESVNYTQENKADFVDWLFTIRPIFPRFLSEFYASTYFRITEGVVSTFQNSRTIRTSFSRKFNKEVINVIIKGERSSLSMMQSPTKGFLDHGMWKCSATKADMMRELSWGVGLVGLTVPHPGEMIVERSCSDCETPHLIARKIPAENRRLWTRGPISPYLGSKTRETTSVLQPWEKNIELGIFRRACDMRKNIGWTSADGSCLSKTIIKNLESLTGVEMEEDHSERIRTGSSKHRLRCSRVSNEGNPAVGFNNLMYVTVTADTLKEINEDNHDFMYQSLICWASVVSTLPNSKFWTVDTTHFHIRDKECVRKITEELLEVDTVYQFKDVSETMKRMLTAPLQILSTRKITIPEEVAWESYSPMEQSYQLGKAQGFLWGLSVFDHKTQESQKLLFPTTITKRVYPSDYMNGLHRGFCLGAVFPPLVAYYSTLDDKATGRFQGSYINIVESALEKSGLVHIVAHGQFNEFTSTYGADVIKSYPAKKQELVEVVRKWFMRKLDTDLISKKGWKTERVLAFAEMHSDYELNMYRVAEYCLPAYHSARLTRDGRNSLENGRKLMKALKALQAAKLPETEFNDLQKILKSRLLPDCQIIKFEARKAAKEMKEIELRPVTIWELETDKDNLWKGSCVEIKCEFAPAGNIEIHREWVDAFKLGQVRCPLMSARRIIQLSTGAHYKLKDIMSVQRLHGDGLFIGDGSGGMGACYLRMKTQRRVIFNSLLQPNEEGFGGLMPSGPGAYNASGPSVYIRCVNYSSCFQDPCDLALSKTWDHFLALRDKHALDIRTICCDAEVFDEGVTKNIENNFLTYLPRIFNRGVGTMIYKTYWNRLLDPTTICHRLHGYFDRVKILLPDTQGSFTSEVYILAYRPIIRDSSLMFELSLETIETIYENVRAKQTYDLEFSRAHLLTYKKAVIGHPLRALYADSVSIATLLSGIGVLTGMSLNLANRILTYVRDGGHPLGLVYVIGYAASREMLPIYSRLVNNRVIVPSSAKLQTLSAVLYGLWFGVSSICQDIAGFQRITERYQHETVLTLGRTAEHIVFTKKSGTYIIWKLTNGKWEKRVDPGPKAGVTQQVARLMICLYKDAWSHREFTMDDLKTSNEILGWMNKGITCKILNNRTGIMSQEADVELELDEIVPEEEQNFRGLF